MLWKLLGLLSLPLAAFLASEKAGSVEYPENHFVCPLFPTHREGVPFSSCLTGTSFHVGILDVRDLISFVVFGESEVAHTNLIEIVGSGGMAVRSACVCVRGGAFALSVTSFSLSLSLSPVLGCASLCVLPPHQSMVLSFSFDPLAKMYKEAIEGVTVSCRSLGGGGGGGGGGGVFLSLALAQ
jgi:hypothetical protein